MKKEIVTTLSVEEIEALVSKELGVKVLYMGHGHDSVDVEGYCMYRENLSKFKFGTEDV